MAFNISEFQSVVKDVGINDSNKFQAIIPAPRALGGTGTVENTEQVIQTQENFKLLQFVCDSANIPSKNLKLLDYQPMNFGKTSKVPTGMTFGDLNLTFMLDSKHKVLKLFELWFQSIINTTSEMAGSTGAIGGRTSYELAYKSEYKTDILLRYFSNDDNRKYIEYKFLDAYPVDMGAVELAWESNNQIAKIPVQFTFSTMSSLQGEINIDVETGRGANNFDQRVNGPR